MFTIQQSVTIARPADQVFAFLADPDNIPRWRPDVLEARSSGGPLQMGSEFDEVINFGGRKAQTFRVDVFEPNKTLEVAAIAGLGIRPTQRYTLSSTRGHDDCRDSRDGAYAGTVPPSGAAVAEDDRREVARLQRPPARVARKPAGGAVE